MGHRAGHASGFHLPSRKRASKNENAATAEDIKMCMSTSKSTLTNEHRHGWPAMNQTKHASSRSDFRRSQAAAKFVRRFDGERTPLTTSYVVMSPRHHTLTLGSLKPVETKAWMKASLVSLPNAATSLRTIHMYHTSRPKKAWERIEHNQLQSQDGHLA